MSARSKSRRPSVDLTIASLDLRYQFAVLEAAAEIAARGAGVFAVLHDLALASAYADELIVLDADRIVAAGAPAEVLDAELISQVFRIDLSREPARSFLALLALASGGRGDRHGSRYRAY